MLSDKVLKRVTQRVPPRLPQDLITRPWNNVQTRRHKLHSHIRLSKNSSRIRVWRVENIRPETTLIYNISFVIKLLIFSL